MFDSVLVNLSYLAALVTILLLSFSDPAVILRGFLETVMPMKWLRVSFSCIPGILDPAVLSTLPPTWKSELFERKEAVKISEDSCLNQASPSASASASRLESNSQGVKMANISLGNHPHEDS
jgi:hypothetical protein